MGEEQPLWGERQPSLAQQAAVADRADAKL